MSSFGTGKSSRNKNNEALPGKGGLRSTKSRSKIKRFPKETIRPEDNPFTVEGTIGLLINDVVKIGSNLTRLDTNVTELKDEHKSTQKSVAGLIPIIRKIVREELDKFRGFP